MAFITCVVMPDLPHYVTQRGNRREPVFFEADIAPIGGWSPRQRRAPAQRS